MLDTLLEKGIALCDAGVGIGKTYAYLTACVLLDKSFPQPGGPIAISTSSIALQNALQREYIPFLSQVFLEEGIIANPLQSVVRKGKGHFVCDLRLHSRLEAVRDKKKNASQRKALYSLKTRLDMDPVPNLSSFDRRMVSIPETCLKTCAFQTTCRYRQYLKQSQSPGVSIQICNHNYLLADAGHRLQGMKPLLKDYRALVIDEAHKLPEAASQMEERQFSSKTADNLSALLAREGYSAMAKRFQEKSRDFLAFFPWDDSVSNRQVSFTLTPEQSKALQECIKALQAFAPLRPYLSRYAVHQLEETETLLGIFLKPGQRYILHIKYDAGSGPILCAASLETAGQLGKKLWEQNVPTILTSGTLAAGGKFASAQKLLGLNDRKAACFTAPSPFPYEENCLLYIPAAPARAEAPAGADVETEAEICSLSLTICQLISATYGHTLVLFTSYALMSGVCTQMKNLLPFPLFVAKRHSQEVIRQFKAEPNAVLFAAGPCWEGMDFPGDQVSSLIIPRLPFPIPDPVGEREKEEYNSLTEYIQAVAVPNMQKKLRQGFGRAIRKETDTCVISILDPRAAPGQRYHQEVLEALPSMPVTQDIADVEAFIRRKRGPEYFAEGSAGHEGSK